MSPAVRSLSNWLLFFVLLVLDQVTKYIANHTLVLGDTVPVISGLFNMTLVFNEGAAFGMFSTLSDTLRPLVLGGVSIVALIVVLRFLQHEAKDDRASQLALFAILSGAVGNIIDRLRLGAVIDFLDFYIGNHHWPAFNVADSAICVGVFVLFVRMVFAKAADGQDARAAAVEPRSAG